LTEAVNILQRTKQTPGQRQGQNAASRP